MTAAILYTISFIKIMQTDAKGEEIEGDEKYETLLYYKRDT